MFGQIDPCIMVKRCKEFQRVSWKKEGNLLSCGGLHTNMFAIIGFVLDNIEEMNQFGRK